MEADLHRFAMRIHLQGMIVVSKMRGPNCVGGVPFGFFSSGGKTRRGTEQSPTPFEPLTEVGGSLFIIRICISICWQCWFHYQYVILLKYMHFNVDFIYWTFLVSYLGRQIARGLASN